MAKPRGTEHTTLTETAALVVRELYSIPGVKMIAPGVIKTGARGRGGKRHITVVHTTAGFELIISGQSVQKVAVHANQNAHTVIAELQKAKKLKQFVWGERERKPGI